ncbi:hypothetical protein CAPTEDRAFT_215843 [Capitella teleta]|uniref:CCHC-type domain-containing protein n=1 Tax=Capitella teleta TaxID=283909 RepID=R7VCU4_CAPTE|nr:hypothetical protein CAPTEDRAFT_215843 [Capitella teleta]|eukprot:ELU13500.1 hypothetical protein CAPTEDRAFT_215843 [Capitella teleta]
MDKLSSQSSTAKNVDAVTKKLHPPKPQKQSHNKTPWKTKTQPQPKKQTPSNTKCTRCGYVHRSTRPDVCPTLGAKCKNCGKMGHFAHVCRSSKVSNIDFANNVGDTDAVGIHNPFLGSVFTGDNDSWKVTLPLEGRNIIFKIDSGANVSILNVQSYKSLPSPPNLSPLKSLLLVSPGGPLDARGYFTANTIWKGTRYKFKVVVVNMSGENPLGRDAACGLGLSARIDAGAVTLTVTF